MACQIPARFAPEKRRLHGTNGRVPLGRARTGGSETRSAPGRL